MKALTEYISESIFDDQDEKVKGSMLKTPESAFWTEFIRGIFPGNIESWYRINNTKYNEITNTLSLDFKGGSMGLMFNEPMSIFNYLEDLNYTRKDFSFKSPQLVIVNNCPVFDDSYLGSHLWIEDLACRSNLVTNVTIDLPEYKTIRFNGCVQVSDVELFCARGKKLSDKDLGEVCFTHISQLPILNNMRIGNCANILFSGENNMYLLKNSSNIFEKLFDLTGCGVKKFGSEKITSINNVNKLFSVISKPKLYDLLRDYNKLYRIKSGVTLKDIGLNFTDLTNTIYMIQIESGGVMISFCRPTIKDCTFLYSKALRNMGASKDDISNRKYLGNLTKNRTADGWVVIAATRQ